MYSHPSVEEQKIQEANVTVESKKNTLLRRVGSHLTGRLSVDMHVAEWDSIEEIIFSPEVTKLGIIVILQSACSHNKSMHNLELFVNGLVYERKKIILNETGMFLSSSKFVPYNIMPNAVLQAVGQLIDSNTSRSVFKKNECVHICFELPTHNSNGNNALGVINVVCGLLLAINEASVANVNQKKTNHKLCIFDVILKSVFFKHRIDYAVVLRKCIRYGYCIVASEKTQQTDAKTAATTTDSVTTPCIPT
jgi:hypothetical protein